MDGLLFDFDALDAALEAEASAASPGLGNEANGVLVHTAAAEARGSPCKGEAAGRPEPSTSTTEGWSEDSDDGLSEVWPDDVPNEQSALRDLLPTTSPEEGAEEVPLGHDGVARPWEVMFSRVVVRASPHFDAPIVGIRSRSELVFEDADCPDPNWVRLIGGRGFILKDGKAKDPTLGLLLKPFALPPAVPRDCQGRVFSALRNAWSEAQTGSNFLKMPEIRRLHRAAEDAIATASKTGGAFDATAFEEAFASKVQALSADVHGGGGSHLHQNGATGGHGGSSGSGTLGALVTRIRASPGAGGSGASGTGVKFWDYTAPRLQRAGSAGRVSVPFVRTLLSSMKRRSLPCAEDVAAVLTQVVEHCSTLPSLVQLQVAPPAVLHIVGDLHGQYWDLLQVLETSGEPSPTNLYLFNGDLVDRGQFSVEVALAVLAMKVASPECVHVNRGNHEAARMNAIFGFQAEVKVKYNEQTLALFTDAFNCLPLATLINERIFVVHGGLSSRPGLRLAAVAALERRKEPEDADELMVELLWSDPMDRRGHEKSPRGGGVLFGPDVTQRFCEDNGLLCVIRSHEMKPQGFEWHHTQRCLTVFSAANYCGVCGNDGAVCDVVPRDGAPRLEIPDLRLRTFEASAQPCERSGQPRFGFFC